MNKIQTPQTIKKNLEYIVLYIELERTECKVPDMIKLTPNSNGWRIKDLYNNQPVNNQQKIDSNIINNQSPKRLVSHAKLYYYDNISC